MKIILTGSGTGGHFYPNIAVAEQLRKIQKEEGIIEMEIFFASSDPYNKEELDRLNIKHQNIKSGKLRTYPSIHTFFDIFKTLIGFFQSLIFLIYRYPDVIFGKGGYDSFPIILAARLLRIPVIIHESDTIPGRVNKWAAKFAEKIMVSFPETSSYFPPEKVVVSGRPIIEDLVNIENAHGAKEFLHINEEKTPVVLILGGSQGAESINSVIIEGLNKLIKKYYIIHQTGSSQFNAVKLASKKILEKSEYSNRYMPFDFLNKEGMKRAAYVSDIIVSRAGSAIFEIATWGKPSILIPYKYAHGNHQHQNAFSYARAGACRVIEEPNLSISLLEMELDNILEDPELKKSMEQAAKKFNKPNSAYFIAKSLSDIGIEHES